MISRRTLLKSGAGTIAVAALGAPAVAQAPKKISFLTWNIIDQEPMIDGWIARFSQGSPGRRGRVARQEGPGVPAVLPDAARRRHAARRHQHARRARARVCGAGRAARPHAAAQGGGRRRKPLQRRLPRRTGPTRARTTCCPSTSPRRCCSTTSRCSRRPASPARRRASTTSSNRRRRSTGERRLGLPDAELRLAVLAAVRHERRRAAVDGPEEADVQHAEGGRSAGQARQGDRSRRDQQDLLDRPLGRAERRLRAPATSACCTPIRPPTSSSRVRATG